MNEDKELLELAAKAAGINVDSWEDCGWSPLSDDGDALRLAVKLRIEIGFYSTLVRAAKQDQDWIGEYYGNDPYAATRRAIVRAAAEIGRGME